MKAQGNKGPEALAPFTDEAGDIAAEAFKAFCQNRKQDAVDLLTRLSPDELDSLGSISRRFWQPVDEAEFAQRPPDPRFGPQTELGIRRLERSLEPLFGPLTCRHPPELGWLTKRGVSCGAKGCGWSWSQEFNPGQYERVQAIHPKVHCSSWRPGDDPTKYHGAVCFWRRDAARAQERRAGFKMVE